MNIKHPTKKAVITLAMASVVGLSTLGVNQIVFPITQADAAATANNSNYASEQALKTLNSFYKPALKGQFPGAVSGLTIGQSTKQNVYNKIGNPELPGKYSEDFDLYSANMGNPGYAISYKLNKIHEIRYFGTNVERQTNIGGITIKMVNKNWYAPNSRETFKNGKTTQTKLTYIRGDYKMEFIFNSSTELDHINLLKK